MNYLIDTNIISEVRKGNRCDANVARWYSSIKSSELYLSVLVLGEIRKGIEPARRRDPPKAAALEEWLEKVSEAFAGRILPIDQAVAGEWGRMNVPDPLPLIDGLLAATARVNGLTPELLTCPGYVNVRSTPLRGPVKALKRCLQPSKPLGSGAGGAACDSLG